ncbi:tRNA (N6-isopentenyl adenosine(37)-C2)-methylthiotransferase MiaB [Parablautia intestinalis]|uniref:tRNA-2-methylthio-N(6)-dimethylallyladenosine synthase n=2 Tax=Parablautia intestinalis TaxID=2320100 RepID=A0A3A9AMW8_9FIRM|nr:tRNA (N6-isopentenyl adenosine(37)-C2)-methylthiotransferase MiaB [Parablautia intestinalis]RKI92737.1 tRNA (N6-isopentenyl adenosine(37)-C2)-methylthiotransferase MiaB [Parablautia intestinalis]
MCNEMNLEKTDNNFTPLTNKPPAKEPDRQYYFIEKCRNYIKKESERLGRPLFAATVTFGCQMNARDSEKLSGILKEVGYELTENEDADFVIYNTCTVRDNANQRVYGRLGHLNSLKKEKKHMKIALCGCMMQEPSVIEKIRSSYRFVDLIFGTHNLYKFAELLAAMFETDEMVTDIWEKTDKIVENLPTERKYPFKSGINIMFGCNNFCSYCIVPYVRGRERSRRPEEIIHEIEKLVFEGVVEVMLLGQNVNSYGKNLEEPITFAELLRRVEQIEGLKRIRFMTSHPKDLSDELIKVMKESKKICRHLHLPLQSGSTRILRAMNRRYTKEQYLALVDKIRKEIPDLAITTDIIVGFPGEELCDVDETIDVVRRVGYDNAFTFIYSRRTGTPAAAMENQVPDAVVREGFDRLLKVVQETARERVRLLEGKTMDALVEEINEQDESLVTGRLSNNTIVHFKGDAGLIGQIVPVYLKECHGFYYLGEKKR